MLSLKLQLLELCLTLRLNLLKHSLKLVFRINKLVCFGINGDFFRKLNFVVKISKHYSMATMVWSSASHAGYKPSVKLRVVLGHTIFTHQADDPLVIVLMRDHCTIMDYLRKELSLLLLATKRFLQKFFSSVIITCNLVLINTIIDRTRHLTWPLRLVHPLADSACIIAILFFLNVSIKSASPCEPVPLGRAGKLGKLKLLQLWFLKP